MVVEEEKIRKEDLFRYTYYNNNHELIGVLDVESLKRILNVDVIVLEENYGETD